MGVLISVFRFNEEIFRAQRKRRLVAFVALTLFFAFCTRIGIPQDGANTEPFSFHVQQNRVVVLTEQGCPVWVYNADFAPRPGVPLDEPRRWAGSYIHPLYGLSGEILTDDAPVDHYHHHGVFWNWPHVAVHRPDGSVETYSPWSGDTRMKTLFVAFKGFQTEDESAQMRVENGWFIAPSVNTFTWNRFGDPLDEKVMTETVLLTTYRQKEADFAKFRVVDLEFEWTVGDFPITLQGAEGKSYGGLTVRFRPEKPSERGVTEIIVPGGVSSDDLYETPLAWGDFVSRFGVEKTSPGDSDDGRSGAAIFVSPDHPDFPPTWLTRHYGPLCVGWPGVTARTFPPGETFRLCYRLWIHDRPVSPEVLAEVYDDYTKSRTDGPTVP